MTDKKELIEKTLEGLRPRVAQQIDAELARREQDQLHSDYRAELSKLRQGDIRSITKLKAAYREMGLNIW